MEEKGFWRDGKNIAIAVLSFLLVCAVMMCGDAENYKTEISELKEEILQLSEKIKESDNRIKGLEEEKEQLETERKELNEQIEKLENPTSFISSEPTNEIHINTDNTTENEDKTETVYITNTGSKYHRDGCSYLKKSQKAISKDDAINRGYEPCSKCNP